MVNYIGPVFQELKRDVGDLRRDMRTMGAHLLHEMKILFETDPRLNLLSDLTKLVEESSSKLEKHDDRFSRLEKDMRALKLEKNPSESVGRCLYRILLVRST